MQQPAIPSPNINKYDPRWFVWTIVFLVVTGVSLVSYIVFSDTGNDEYVPIGPVHAKNRVQQAGSSTPDTSTATQSKK